MNMETGRKCWFNLDTPRVPTASTLAAPLTQAYFGEFSSGSGTPHKPKPVEARQKCQP
jgi:hypothetical protein